MEIDETIEQVKALIAKRDEIYAQLEAILGGERPPATKRTIHCGNCDGEGHTARTCKNPPKPQE
jgi:hypothetical protein